MLGMIFHSLSHDVTVMLIGLGLVDMGHETYVASQKRDLLEALKTTIQ
jgi:hypothetical protein